MIGFVTSKWLWLALGSVGVLTGLWFNSKTVMHTEIFIDAPPEDVWAVLMDTEKYPEWNPVFVEVDGKLEVGASLANQVVQPGKDAVQMNSSVKAIVANKEINQGGGIPGILTFDHRYMLKAENGGTRVIQHEVDQGLYMYFWDSSWVEPAYASVNEALKRRMAELNGDADEPSEQ